MSLFMLLKEVVLVVLISIYITISNKEFLNVVLHFLLSFLMPSFLLSLCVNSKYIVKINLPIVTNFSDRKVIIMVLLITIIPTAILVEHL